MIRPLKTGGHFSRMVRLFTDVVGCQTNKCWLFMQVWNKFPLAMIVLSDCNMIVKEYVLICLSER